MDLTSKLAREAGINQAEIGEVHRYRESTLFSETEKDVLAFAEAVTATPARVPQELLERLQARLSTPQLVELAAAIALQNFSARFNRALDIT